MLHPGGGTISTEQQWWSGKTLDIWPKTSSKNAALSRTGEKSRGPFFCVEKKPSSLAFLRWLWCRPQVNMGHTGKFPKLHSTLPHLFQDSEDSLSQAGCRHQEKRSGTFLTCRKRPFYFLDKFIRQDRCISYQKVLPSSVACNLPVDNTAPIWTAIYRREKKWN